MPRRPPPGDSRRAAHDRLIALAIGLVVAVLWGFHDLIVRMQSAGSDVYAAMLVVLLSGAVCLLPLALVGDGAVGGAAVGTAGDTAGDTAWPGGRALALTVAAGIMLAIATRCLWGAFGAGPVRIVSPITTSYPVFSLALAAAAGTSVPPLAWLATLVVIAGVATVASGEVERDVAYSLPRAVAWALGAALAYALTFALGQAVMAEEAALPTLLVSRLAAAGVVLAVMLGSGGLRWPARATLPVLCAAGALDALALGLVFWAGRFEHASFATVTASLFGVVTILLAAAFLKERLTARQWVGVGIVFAAIALLGSVVE